MDAVVAERRSESARADCGAAKVLLNSYPFVLLCRAGQTPEIVPGEPGWNPALASDSEAAVSAGAGGSFQGVAHDVSLPACLRTITPAPHQHQQPTLCGCRVPSADQIRAEKAPSLNVEELQAHSINVIQHLHHDGEHPGSPTAEVGSHDTTPSHNTVRLRHGAGGFAGKQRVSCCTGPSHHGSVWVAGDVLHGPHLPCCSCTESAPAAALCVPLHTLPVRTSCWRPLAQVHNPSEAPAIKDNMKASEEKLKDAHDPL